MAYNSVGEAKGTEKHKTTKNVRVARCFIHTRLLLRTKFYAWWKVADLWVGKLL